MGAVSIVSVLRDIIVEQYEVERYRAYLYECIRIIGENTAGLVKEGKYIPTTYDEAIHQKPQDNRTAEEIVADVVKKAGLEVRNSEFV